MIKINFLKVMEMLDCRAGLTRSLIHIPFKISPLIKKNLGLFTVRHLLQCSHINKYKTGSILSSLTILFMYIES